MESCQQLRKIDDGGRDRSEEVGKLKRGPKGKGRKKQPRRLPVDELVLSYERVAELNPPIDDGEDSFDISLFSADYIFRLRIRRRVDTGSNLSIIIRHWESKAPQGCRQTSCESKQTKTLWGHRSLKVPLAKIARPSKTSSR